jgi:hypothetical protein
VVASSIITKFQNKVITLQYSTYIIELEIFF